MVPPHPVCLERDVAYTLRFEFRRYQDANSILNGAANAVLLVDSVRLISFSRPLKYLTYEEFVVLSPHTNISLSLLFKIHTFADCVDAPPLLHGDVQCRGPSL